MTTTGAVVMTIMFSSLSAMAMWLFTFIRWNKQLQRVTNELSDVKFEMELKNIRLDGSETMVKQYQEYFDNKRKMDLALFPPTPVSSVPVFATPEGAEIWLDKMAAEQPKTGTITGRITPFPATPRR